MAADCPDDFYGAQISLAVDRAGTILAAYVANATARAAMRLYAITSSDGLSWSAPTDLGARGTGVGADFPAVAAGPRPGDFRVAWEDDGNGRKAWNVWYRATVNLGASWSPAVRVSDRGVRRALQDERRLPVPLRRLLRPDGRRPRC